MNIIEEKIQNMDGDITYKQYLRGRYLGKVGSGIIVKGRLCEML